VRPLFILGLPRTGTTLLFNLLAQDPAHRWMSNWEAGSPVPPPEPGPDRRRRRAVVVNRITNWLVPDLQRKHAFETDGPEECGHLMWNTFEAEVFSVLVDVPTYRTWLYRRNRVAGYRHYQSQLQLLLHHRPAERLLLKLPSHVFNLDALLTVFPDACVVQTHRDPLKVLPSTCSLQASYRDAYAELVDCGGLGKEVSEHLAYGLDRCLDVRATAPAERFYDVDYQALLHDPMTVIEGIYRWFGLPLADGVLARMRTYLANNPQNRHGPHRYSLEDFGLRAEAVTKRYKRYTDEFRIPSEGTSRP
jgi:hypothetical protein